MYGTDDLLLYFPYRAIKYRRKVARSQNANVRYLLVQIMKLFNLNFDTQKLLLSFNLLWDLIQSFSCQWWDSFIIFLNLHDFLKDLCDVLFFIFPYLKTSSVSRSSGICYCVNFILFNFITEKNFYNRMTLELPQN